MGGASQRMLQDEENGFSSSDNRVCSKHFDDEGINDFIKRNQIDDKCSYCASKKSVALDEVMLHIMQSVRKFYGLPEDGNGIWDPEFHEWIDEYPDTNQLLFFDLAIEVEPYEIQEEIERLTNDDAWVERDRYATSEGEMLYDDWDFFAEVLKKQLRYVFFKAKVNRRDQFDLDTNKVDPSVILDDIGKLVNGLSLIKTFKRSSPLKLFRARQHATTDKVDNYTEIASPHHNRAKSNRFSSAGISMFYGAMHKDTAISEVLHASKTEKLITVAKFTIKQDLNLIDLTDLPTISMFDEKRNDYLNRLEFLNKFVESIRQPLEKNSSEHIAYVPTQVVTEYFRHIYTEEYNKEIHGIMYKSAKDNKVCYVLFFDSSQCTQNGRLYEKDKPVVLTVSSLKTQPIKGLIK